MDTSWVHPIADCLLLVLRPLLPWDENHGNIPNLSGVAGDYECKCNMWTSSGGHEDKTGVHCREGRVLGGGWPAETAVGAFQGDGAGVCASESTQPPGVVEEFSNYVRN
jgi:hypothetical protein